MLLHMGNFGQNYLLFAFKDGSRQRLYVARDYGHPWEKVLNLAYRLSNAGNGFGASQNESENPLSHPGVRHHNDVF
jgi:hypothetical protein